MRVTQQGRQSRAYGWRDYIARARSICQINFETRGWDPIAFSLVRGLATAVFAQFSNIIESSTLE